jgi:hypothetical protein
MAYIPIELHLALVMAHTLFKTFLTLAMVYIPIEMRMTLTMGYAPFGTRLALAMVYVGIKMYTTFYLNYGLHSHQNAPSPLCLHGKPNYALHSP